MDIDRVDLLKEAQDPNWFPTDELVHSFIKRRSTLRKPYKDFRAKQSGKLGWMHSRWTHMKGINSFHKSTAGKKFHRSLGNFMATRIMKGAESYVDPEHIIAACSLRTHLYLELLNFHPLDQEVELLEMLESVIPTISNLEHLLFTAFTNSVMVPDIQVSEDTDDMLFSLIDSVALSEALSLQIGEEAHRLRDKWEKSCEIASKDKDTSPIDIFRKMVGVDK